MKPPKAAPAVNPLPTIIMMVTRSLRGLYSPTRATAFGMMAPNAVPARKRITSICCTFAAWAVKKVRTEKHSVTVISTGRRPILSASMLNSSEPTKIPKSPAPNTRSKLGVRDVPFLQDGRCNIAHGLHVETVHDQAEAAQDAQAQLKSRRSCCYRPLRKR